MSLRFKDVIQEFEPEQVDELVLDETELAPPTYTDGTTALFVTEFQDAVDALSTVLEEETQAIPTGRIAALEDYAHAKQSMIDGLEALTRRTRNERIELSPDLKAIILRHVERLDRAVDANTRALVAMRKAVLAINHSLITAVEKGVSENIYTSNGVRIPPVELSIRGLDAAL
jgi:flagellar biosynthesis/type III secretory pathway chaperone